MVIRRRLERGVESVECPIPAVITVNSSAPESLAAKMVAERDYLKIVELTVNDIVCDEQQLGLTGSPTKVKRIENVVFQAKEAKRLTASDEDINGLMVELIASHTLG